MNESESLADQLSSILEGKTEKEKQNRAKLWNSFFKGYKNVSIFETATSADNATENRPEKVRTK